MQSSKNTKQIHRALTIEFTFWYNDYLHERNLNANLHTANQFVWNWNIVFKLCWYRWPLIIFIRISHNLVKSEPCECVCNVYSCFLPVCMLSKALYGTEYLHLYCPILGWQHIFLRKKFILAKKRNGNFLILFASRRDLPIFEDRNGNLTFFFFKNLHFANIFSFVHFPTYSLWAV